MARTYVFRPKWDAGRRNRNKRSRVTLPDGLAANQALGSITQSATIALPGNLAVTQTLASVIQATTFISGTAVTATQLLDSATQTATLAVNVAVATSQSLSPVTQTATATVLGTISAAQTLSSVTQTSTLGVVPHVAASQSLDPLTQVGTLGAVASIAATQTLGGVAQSALLIAGAAFSANQTLSPLIVVTNWKLSFGGASGSSVALRDKRLKTGLEPVEKKPKQPIEPPNFGVPLPPPEYIRPIAAHRHSSPLDLIDPRLMPTNLVDLQRQIQQAQDESDIAALERFLDSIES